MLVNQDDDCGIKVIEKEKSKKKLIMKFDTPQIYRNAMEYLVAEEVQQQLKLVPPKLAEYLEGHNLVEVIAYALNRLPALYATSEEGWEQQKLKGKRDFNEQIVVAVRQAIAAVNKDPLRVSNPLKLTEENEYESIFLRLKSLLQREDISWANLVDVIEETLLLTVQGKITWRRTKQNNSEYKLYQRMRGNS